MLTSSLLLLACAGDPAPGDSADTGEPLDLSVDPPDSSGLIAVGDANNYAFDGALDGPTIELGAGVDATISFGTLDKDLQCHDLDPVADIDNVTVLLFRYLTEAEVEDGLSNDTLDMADLSLYAAYEPGDATEFALSDLMVLATDPDLEEEFLPENGTFLVLLTTGTTVGKGARMIAFLQPEEANDTHTGSITGGCDVLDYEADLTHLKPVAVLPEGPWNLDWSGLTTTGQGGEFVSTDVTGVMLAYYADLDPAALEEDFLDLELNATAMWNLEHAGGTTADLAALVDADGAAFPGFDAEGTYLAALRCEGCPNPAPLALTQLVPWRE